MKIIKYNIVTFAMAVTLAGCSASGTNYSVVQKANFKLEKSNSPYRLTLKNKSEDYSTYTLKPAGKIGDTIAESSPTLLRDINKEIQLKCGFRHKELTEIRIVSYEQPEFHEVWVYKSKQSLMPKNQIALSVILIAYPDAGGTDIYLYGECNPEPKEFTFQV
ncbi:MAG: hypothetical protein JKY55_20595 [Aliivibrio sp.]|uniref:hypothetical protein n=1 Tax=Aliivibrio sp. TaxID=1872443 RepID=UPI001A5C68B9|nr:hypothetical protein [Aliivibrio sp.]